METWKIIGITVVSAVVLGCIIGAVIGKYQLKKAQSDYKPLLSFKEKLVYFTCFALGAGLVLFGVFYDFSTGNEYGDMVNVGDIQVDGDFEEIQTDSPNISGGAVAFGDDAVVMEEAVRVG